MPGEDKQIQNQTQNQSGVTSGTTSLNQSGATNSATGPWDPAKPLLEQILSRYSGLNTDVTPAQADAAKSIQAGASAIPSFGGAAADAANRLFTSDTSNQIGMLNKTLADYQANVGKTAAGEELDPYATPGFGDAITTMSNDITNRVKGVYAGAGRDPSGAGSFAKSLGKGLTEGIAPVIASQYNANKGRQMDAAKGLYDAGGGTAANITSQGQVPLSNAISGVGLLPQVGNAFTAPGTAQAAAADYANSLPFGNLSKLLAPLLQLGGAGTQTTGSTNTNTAGTNAGTSLTNTIGHGETIQPQNTLSNIMGGVSGGLGILSLLSDENAKEGMKPVGKLNDGQTVFKFRYKGDPVTRIGLSAQQVSKKVPSAVGRLNGLLRVDYDEATKEAEAA